VSPADSLFERILARRDAGRARRAQALPIVKGAETIKELTPLGLLEWYLHPDIPGQLIRSILSYVLEIPPGSRSGRLQHQGGIVHMVLQGEGWTLLDGTRHDWRERSCIALPARPNGIIYQHFNASGTGPARYYAVTTAPLVMSLFHNHDFVFNNPFVFKDRFSGEAEAFSGKGTFLASRIWEANFIPDVNTFSLIEWKERGAGGRNIMFELANNTLVAHISEFPVGTYKKAHRHGPGAHVITLSGKGYSLLWLEGAKPTKVDWREGSVVVPPDLWWHQHFNAGASPARYLAIRWGSVKHKLDDKYSRLDQDRATGGNQIEYADEDPSVRARFESELSKEGVQSGMPAVSRR